MARIRTVKPEVAKHELLFEIEQELQVNVRFAWVLLPGHCDREGRFKWRPNALKTDILPYDKNCDFSRVLDACLTRGLLVRYRVGDEWYGWIPTFRKHQAVNPRETPSQLPGVDTADEVIDYRNQSRTNASGTREPRDYDASSTRDNLARGEGKGREGNGKEGNSQNAREPIRPITAVDDGRHQRPAPTDLLERLKAGYPTGTYRQSEWLIAHREALNRLEEGVDADALLAGIERYRAQCEARGSIGTQFVLSPAKFFAPTREGGPPPYTDPFPVPAERLTATDEINAACERLRGETGRVFDHEPTAEPVRTITRR